MEIYNYDPSTQVLPDITTLRNDGGPLEVLDESTKVQITADVKTVNPDVVQSSISTPSVIEKISIEKDSHKTKSDKMDLEPIIYCLPSKTKVFWAYIIIMATVAVILYAMIFSPQAFRHGGAGEKLPHPDVNSVIWGVLFFVFAYVGYTGYFNAHSERQRNVGNLILGLILLTIIILGFVQYRQRDLTNATIAAIVFGIFVGWWILHMWDIDRVAAYLLFIPLAWAIHISISLYISRDRTDKTPQTIGQGIFG